MENIIKTSVAVSSTDKNLFGIVIRQDNRTGFLNLSDLQESYTHARVLNKWGDKRVYDILATTETQERIFFLLQKEIDMTYGEFKLFIEGNTFLSLLKSKNLYLTNKRGNFKATWCHKLIFCTVCMDLHPSFYVEIVNLLAGLDSIFKIVKYNLEYKGVSLLPLDLPDNGNMYTYLVLDKANNLYKIGKTTDLKKRLNSLLVANLNIHLICYVEKDIESYLHTEYVDHRVYGEWFDIAHILDEVKTKYNKELVTL